MYWELNNIVYTIIWSFLQFRIIALWFDFLPLHQILIENDEKTSSLRTKLFLLIIIKGTKVNWTINFEKCCNLERQIIWVGEASHRFPIHHQRLHHIRSKQNSTRAFFSFWPLRFSRLSYAYLINFLWIIMASRKTWIRQCE